MSDLEDKFDVVLDMAHPDFANQLMAAIGAKTGGEINLIAPQFDRTDGLVVPIPLMDFAKLPALSIDTLHAIGCKRWDAPDDQRRVLWLFPAEWYDHIPDGTEVVDINLQTKAFKRGETDDDRRFGCLSYGFYRAEDGAIK
jgi:hypothetical protein